MTEIPEADVFLGIGRNTDIVNAIDQALQGERVVEFAPKDELVMDAERVLTNAPYYAYIKLADGCDHRSTYCAIPNIRGPVSYTHLTILWISCISELMPS